MGENGGMMSTDGHLPDGGGGGALVAPDEAHANYATLARAVIAKFKEAEPGADDLARARQLVESARESKHPRNRLAAGRLAAVIAEIERKHARWAADHLQSDRQHTERMGRNVQPDGPTINNYGIIKIIKGVDGDRI